ncbi:MAG: ribonuclease E/G [Lachnospiraceae bacterium]|nr:ribonuclease E/G [Lachnospiraceae bacterium]
MNKFVVINKENIKLGYYFKNDKLSDLRCYEEDSILNNVYVGRVSNILTNIKAAFVDIKPGFSCYLSMEDYKSDKKLRIGDIIIVQISKDSIKTKQPSVTTDICLTGKYVIIHAEKTVGVSSKIKDDETRERLKSLFENTLKDFNTSKKCSDISYGAIIRTHAADEDVSEELITHEITGLLTKLDTMLDKAKYMTAYSKVYESEPAYIKDMALFSEKEECEVVTDDEKIYAEFVENHHNPIRLYADSMISLTNLYNLKSLTEKALTKRAYLKSGAYLVIEPTEAMTVIDVNTGKAIHGNNSEEYIFKINCEAAKEIARQLKIRNLSGIIIIDFISMKNERLNNELLSKLKEYTLKDETPVKVVDITRLGLVELTRKKVRKPLYEMAGLIK